MISHSGFLYPDSLAEALRLLAQTKQARVLAGGTELLPRLRRGKEPPAVLLDITRAGLDYMEPRAGGLAIGATTLLHDVQYHPLVVDRYSALAEASAEVGGLQTRNLGTIGGNICGGVPSADLAPALLVLGAVAVVKRAQGERVVSLDSFFAGPRQTVLDRDEIVTEIVLPPAEEGSGSAFKKMGKRRAMRLAVVNCSAWVKTDGDRLTAVRVAMGNVAPVPLRLRLTEACLVGRRVDEATLSKAAGAMLSEICPRDSLRASADYRRAVAVSILGRTLTEAFGRAVGVSTR